MTTHKESFETLLLEKDSEAKIWTLTINRPESLNALNEKVLTELELFLKNLHQEKESRPRCLILTGSGEKAFVAGADIVAMSKMNPKEAEEFGRLGQKVTLMMEKINIPLIAALNGHALGGGLELAMSADLIYATNSALLGLPEVTLGLIPGFGGTQRLERLVGRQQAKELIYSAKKIKGPEAKRIGLVLELFDTQKELRDHCFQMAKTIAQNSPLGVGTAKKVMFKGNDCPIAEGLNIELEQFAALFSSKEKVEGMTAFIEKRKPQF